MNEPPATPTVDNVKWEIRGHYLGIEAVVPFSGGPITNWDLLMLQAQAMQELGRKLADCRER